MSRNTPPRAMGQTKRRRHHSANEWAYVKPLISHYYVQMNMTLGEMMDLMNKKHSFEAGKRMYKHMIKMWGMAKYTERVLPTDGLYGHRLLKGKKHARAALPHRKSWGAQEYFNKSLCLHDRPLSSQTQTLTTFDAQNTRPCFESSFEIQSTSANTLAELMVSKSVSATETIGRPCRQPTTEFDARHQLDNNLSPPVEISIPDRIEVHRLSAKLEEVIRQAGGQICFDDFKTAFELCEKVEQGLWNKLEQTTIDQLLSLRRAALAHLKADDFRLAVFGFRTLLELSKRFLGPNHSLIAVALGSLAVLFQSREDFNTAEVYYLKLVQHHEESSQGESFHMLFAVRGLAHVHLQQAHQGLKVRWTEAISKQERAVSLSRKFYGPADDVTEECLWDLLQYIKSGRELGAIETRFRDKFDMCERANGDEEDALWSLRCLAYIHILQGRFQEALSEIEKLCERCQGQDTVSRSLALLFRCHQAKVLQQLHLDGPCIMTYEILVSAYEDLNGPDDISTLRCVANLAECYAVHGSAELASHFFQRAVNGYDDLGDSLQMTRYRICWGVLLKTSHVEGDGDALIAKAVSDLNKMTFMERLGLLDVISLLIRGHLDCGEIEIAESRCRETTALLKWTIKRSWLPFECVLRFVEQVAEAFGRTERHEISEQLYSWIAREDDLRYLDDDAVSGVFGKSWRRAK